MSDISARVYKIVGEQLSVHEDAIVPGANFVEDLGADELQKTDLILAVEDEFDIEIPDEEAERINTVQDIINYIRRGEA